MKKKILVFLRVNSNAQEKEQREVMRQWLNGLGYQDEEIEYCAVGTDNIDSVVVFVETQSGVYNGRIKAVAAWDIASLGRSESDLLKLKMFLIERRVQLLVREPAIKLLNDDGTVSMGANMLFSVCAAMVETNLSKL